MALHCRPPGGKSRRHSTPNGAAKPGLPEKPAALQAAGRAAPNPPGLPEKSAASEAVASKPACRKSPLPRRQQCEQPGLPEKSAASKAVASKPACRKSPLPRRQRRANQLARKIRCLEGSGEQTSLPEKPAAPKAAASNGACQKSPLPRRQRRAARLAENPGKCLQGFGSTTPFCPWYLPPRVR